MNTPQPRTASTKIMVICLRLSTPLGKDGEHRGGTHHGGVSGDEEHGDETAQGEQGILPQALPPQGGGHLGETCHWALASPISRTASSSSSWKVRRSFSPRARVRHTPPVPQDDHPVAEGGGKGVVGYHEDGGLQGFLGLFKGANHRPAGLAVQVAGGFVRQDQQGMVDERPGHGGTLLLTAGDLRRVFVPDGGDTEYIAQLVRPGLRLAGDGAADDGGQENVLPDRQTVQQQEVLEHKAQLPVADLCQSVLAEICQLPIPSMIPQNESNATGSMKVFPSCWKNSHNVIFGVVLVVIKRLLVKAS